MSCNIAHFTKKCTIHDITFRNDVYDTATNKPLSNKCLYF